MAEYFDMDVNLFTMFDAFVEGRKYRERSGDSPWSSPNTTERAKHNRRRRRFVDPNIFEVRPSICVAGVSQPAVAKVVKLVSDLMVEPLPIESFHVKTPSDVKDGALLVPKVVLAAAHCPGRKLIDETYADGGQLDFIYDEVCETGADVMVIYVDLPRVIYPPNRSFVYHQRLAELLFPTQPVLQTLAMNNSLVTLTESTSLNHIQRNVIREWISKPVGRDHRVYRAAADYRSAAESCRLEEDYWSETELYQRGGGGRIPRGLAVGWGGLSRGFASAGEADRRPTDDDDDWAGNEEGSRSGWMSKRRRKKKRSTYGSLPARRGASGGGDTYRPELKPLLESNGRYDSQELLLFDDGDYGEEINLVVDVETDRV